MHILLCGSFDDDERDAWLAELQDALPDARWHLTVTPADAELITAAVVANPRPGSLRGLPNLRLIQSLWAGVDRLLSDPSLPDVPLARMVDPAMSAAMAETALWATLSLHRHFYAYARQQHARDWQQLPQRRADEIQVTLLGTGQMGSVCATRLLALGYRVTGWSLHGGTVEGLSLEHGEDALWPLLARSDIVINLLPLTAQTSDLLDQRFFAALRPGAGLINLARGGHLVEADLLQALACGQVGHAVLDVFRSEPLPSEHPFWSHPQVTVLPHVAAATDMRSAARIAAHNLLALRDGQPLSDLVERSRGY
ncbi:glyoxylate/hydroxypyruvate reductase A [Stutzerimonas decontaminans]|jgi:glyoxylate/hydroxypyruvate reductase A|uniref:Glyoxylate/hydroxypyruvate reductase A n=1 Tax=Stutzerimonas decontaminans TaxID=3022791 RepID=A0ABX4VYJ8_9GAMM|nr:glyoxylate/hydroxypyruvate reductase A [Stutzerimonas decontaminans]MCQ4245669.1 glyoxylate/hydroxypyruvate reductase A [Stutzerimonas decontaminans]PNF84943.1 glyoxylate/hydroxypyruvate reductase A [Stutzerimonas decontaminans]